MDLSKLRFQNKFWDRAELIEEDFHLKLLQKHPLTLTHPIEQKIQLDEDRIYIIRGPRQVGKTTLSKKILKNLLKRGIPPKRLFYFAFDIGNIKNDEETADLLQTYITFARENFPKERLWLFLDEVTYTRDWAVGIKRAYDSGLLVNTTLLITGSSSLDLKRGGERLPGRRGLFAHENDLLMLPLSFRSFLENIYHLANLTSISKKITPEKAYHLAFKLNYYQEELEKALEEYLLCGGFPLSILSLKSTNQIDPSVYFTYLSAFLGDLTRAGKKETYLREILSVVLNIGQEPLDWLHISQAAGIGSHHTVREYIEVMEAFFVLKILYALKNLGGYQISFKKRKKIYFFDPFLYTLFQSWTKGEVEPYQEALKLMDSPERKAKLVENLVGIHLFRYYSRLAYWRNRGEIDFIALDEDGPKYFEVKYQTQIVSQDKKSLRKVHGGIIISQRTLAYDHQHNIAIIPAYIFLSLLDVL